VFQGVNEDVQVWLDAEGRSSWTRRFIDYLKAHGRLKDLAFFSFEHYPMSLHNLLEQPLRRAHAL